MRIIKKFIAIIMLIIQFFCITKSVNAANIGETKDLERGELGYYCVQKWNGSRWIYLTYNQTFYTDTDGQKYIAYCLSPGLPGVGYVSGEKESYQVKINELLNNDVIWRVLKNGYPNKSIEELGVETADDAYFATMQAINSILRGYTLEQAKELYIPGQFAINGESYDDVQRRGNKTVNALFKLIEIGLYGTETRDSFLNISIRKESELVKENEESYSQKYKIQSSAEISKYNIHKLENLPDGSYVSDMQGNKRTEFNGGEEFKVIIPSSKITEDIKGKIFVKAMQKNYPIYYGKSTIEGHQDYALCNNSYAEVTTSTDLNIKTDKSKLIIVKVDNETQKPLEGVKFQITTTEGKTITYVTDKNGKIEIDSQKPGIIKVKEIATLKNYKLNNEEQTIELKFNEVKEIKLTNRLQKGNIKIIKVDKDNNEIKLENVRFEIRDENNKLVKEGVTDKNGELEFKNILVGKYKVVETNTNKKYRLNGEEIKVDVVDGKTKTIKIENELQKGNIKIIKVDKDNNEIKLENVKFELRDENNKLVKEGVTDKNGELEFKNILVGKYKVVETNTNKKYRLNGEEIKVDVVDGKTKTIKIENELQKGNIKIIKVDKDNNEIKLENVKFELRDENNKLVKEGVTDKNGELEFKNVLVGKYKIVETKTNKIYRLNGEKIEVDVVDGKNKICKIENEKIKKVEEAEKPKEEISNKKLPKTGNDYFPYITASSFIIFLIYNIKLFIKKC